MAKNIFRKELATLNAYVPGKPIEKVMEEYGLKEVVKLASNENPLGPSKLAIEAIIEEASNVNIYPDPSVDIVKEKLFKKHGIPKEQMILGNGGEEIIKMIAMTFLNEGDEAIMADPTFSLYDITVSHMGGVSVKIPLNDFQQDLDVMLNAISEKTKLMYICNPNNPIGNILTKEVLDDFVSKLPEEVVLVLDEAYFEYASKNDEYPDGLDVLKRRPNTIVLRTFAKVAGLAGLRIGYAFSSEEIINEMAKTKGVFNVNRLAQVAAAASMDDTEHIKNTVELSYQSLGYMMNYFDSKGLKYIQPNANFIFADTGMDSKQTFIELQKKGMIMRPGFIWGYDTWVRISSGNMADTEKFIAALDEIIR
ncbi:MAG: histidinol-phosphate transaminase [Clostridiales bacterium]|nr:histidinol-phosphate transaminase [Clostridiales bacterium]